MGVEVAVVVEEDLSEVDVVVGVPAEDGLGGIQPPQKRSLVSLPPPSVVPTSNS